MGQKTNAACCTTPSNVAAGNGDKGASAIGEAAKGIDELRFQLLRSALYHDMLNAKWARVHRLLTFFSVLLSTAAVAAFGGSWPWIGQIGGVAVAVISTVQLVWDFSSLSVRHGDLRRRFYELLADLDDGVAPDAIRAKLPRIFPDEPAISDDVNRRAHNMAGESVYGAGNFDLA